jgi:hypothetical protein
MSNAFIRSASTLMLALVTWTGTLLDQTTGQPLVKVQVTAAGPASAHATTDAHGRFTLTGLQPGAYAITVESNDVPQQRFSVKLAPNTATFTIKACSTTLDYHCGPPGDGPGPG